MSRCETTARRTLASCCRTCPCWCGGKTAIQPVDRLGGVERVYGRHHEVPGLGRRQAGLDRLEVAHLADQDDVRVLAQRAAECLRERARVDLHLPLVDDRTTIVVEILDRVFHRDDVGGARAVDVVNQRRKRGALAAAGGTGQQDKTAFRLGDGLEDRRQLQLLDRADLYWDHAKDHGNGAPLTKHVAAEAAEPGDAVGEVHLMLTRQARLKRPRQQRGCHRVQRGRVERAVLGDRAQVAVHPQYRIVAALEVEVGRPGLHRCGEKLGDVHHGLLAAVRRS